MVLENHKLCKMKWHLAFQGKASNLNYINNNLSLKPKSIFHRDIGTKRVVDLWLPTPTRLHLWLDPLEYKVTKGCNKGLWDAFTLLKMNNCFYIVSAGRLVIVSSRNRLLMAMTCTTSDRTETDGIFDIEEMGVPNKHFGLWQLMVLNAMWGKES